MAPESSLCPFAVNSQSLREKKIILSTKVSFASYIRVQILKENLIGSGQPIDCNNPVCPSPITHDGGGTRQKEARPCGQVDRPS